MSCRMDGKVGLDLEGEVFKGRGRRWRRSGGEEEDRLGLGKAERRRGGELDRRTRTLWRLEAALSYHSASVAPRKLVERRRGSGTSRRRGVCESR